MSTDDRLDSWKEIAAYLKRGVRTAQRWERVAGLPVRRVASERGVVYAFRSELDAWWRMQSAKLVDGVDLSTPRTAAYDAYLKARDHSSASTPHRPMRVRTFLSPAITIDPDFAPAHASLAVYFFTLVVMGLVRPEEGMPAAVASRQRAIDLDPSIAEAHAVFATVAGIYNHDWLEAERRFEIALMRQPVPSAVRFQYAIWVLSPLRRHGEALAQLERGLADDPLYLVGRLHVAMELHSLDRSEEAVEELDRILKIDPGFGPALGLLGREYAIRGRVGDALSFAERAYAAIPRHPNAVGFLAGMLRRTGNPGRSREVLARLESGNAWSLARARAESHIVCVEPDAAVESIRTAVAERDPGVWLLFAGTAGNMIRSTRQWPTLRAQLNLPHRE